MVFLWPIILFDFRWHKIMYYTFRQQKFLCTLWSLALAKKSCNNINNSRAQVSRLCYFLWLCSHLPLLIGLILEGSKHLNISDTTASVALKLSELVLFNAVKKKRTGMNCRRSKKNEPPLPVLIGLACIHKHVKKKS